MPTRGVKPREEWVFTAERGLSYNGRALPLPDPSEGGRSRDVEAEAAWEGDAEAEARLAMVCAGRPWREGR